jgi:hypothetical protein
MKPGFGTAGTIMFCVIVAAGFLLVCGAFFGLFELIEWIFKCSAC